VLRDSTVCNETIVGVSVLRPRYTSDKAVSLLILPKSICPVFFLFEDIDKFKAAQGIVRVFFERE
jgi:hypothetical protein